MTHPFSVGGDGSSGVAPRSLAGLLELVERDKKTTSIVVSSADGEWLISIVEGALVHVRDRVGGPSRFRSILVGSGGLTEADWAALTSATDGSGRPIEDELAKRTIVSPAVVGALVAWDARETILDLFTRVGLSCQFRTDGARPPSVAKLPIAVEGLLKEAKRRQKRRANLRRLVGADETVFVRRGRVLGGGPLWMRRLRGALGRVGLGAASRMLGGDSSGSAAVPSGGAFAEPVGSRGPSDALCEWIHQWVDGIRSISEITRCSGLGEYVTIEALSKLMDRGAIETAEDASKSRRALMRVPTWALGALVIVALGALALFAQWGDSSVVEAARLKELDTKLDELRLDHARQAAATAARDGELGTEWLEGAPLFRPRERATLSGQGESSARNEPTHEVE